METDIIEWLKAIDRKVTMLMERQTVKHYYDTREFAMLVGRAEFTVREWCRNQRILAKKRRSGRGASQAWVVPHEEFERFQRDGLLPLSRMRPTPMREAV